MEIIGIIVGLPLGILASLLAWWILTHKIVPKVVFAPFISKVKVVDKEKYKYRIGIKNDGNRDMVDVEIIVELIIKGFDKDVPTNTSHLKINLNKPSIPKLKKGNRWALSINTNELPKSLATEFKGCDFEDLLKIKTAKARILIFGYDEFSGSRKVFESQNYILNDIKEELFEEKVYE